MNLNSSKFGVLLSYAHVKQTINKVRSAKSNPGTMRWGWTPEALAWLFANPNVDILIDCGAFTFAKRGIQIAVGEYMSFIDEYLPKIWGYFALDVIKDPMQSRKNLQAMWKTEHRPIPIHVAGEEQSWMDECFKHSPLVAIASGVRNREDWDPPSWFAMKTRWAKGRPVHWLGYCDIGLAQTVKPYSVDSSSWMQSARFGVAMVYLGNGRRIPIEARNLRKGILTKKNISQKELMRAVTAAGCAFSDFINPDKWKGAYDSNPAVLVSTYGWVQYIREIQERFGVRWFLSLGHLGPWCAVLMRAIERVDKTCIQYATGHDYKQFLGQPILERGMK